MNIKNNLLAAEEEFNFFKSGIEKKHIYFVILYFAPPALAAVFLSKYYRELYDSLIIKILIFGLAAIGLAIHFCLKNTYYKTNKKYKEFIDYKLSPVKKQFENDEEFRKAVIEGAKEIFHDRNLELSNISVKKYVFWENIFIILGLESDDTL
jgi:hypothetical protein